MWFRWTGTARAVVTGFKAAAFLGACSVLGACAGKHRAPYVDETLRPPGDTSDAGGPAMTDPGTDVSGSGGSTDNGSGSDDLGTLDPNRVYIIGELATTKRTTNLGLADVFRPKTYTLAVPGSRSPYVVHGTLLCLGGDGPSEMGADYTGSDPPDAVPYPADPFANDTAVDAPCPDEMPATRVLAGPDAQLIYECHDKSWYQAGRELVPTTPMFPDFQALGHGDLALLWTSADDFSVLHLKDMKLHPIADAVPIAVRASDGGFLYAIQGPRSLELHEIDSSGNVTNLGNYPLPLDSTDLSLSGAQLDGQGNVFVHAKWSDHTKTEQLVVEMVFGGDSEVIYRSETDEPYVLLRYPDEGLLTGP